MRLSKALFFALLGAALAGGAYALVAPTTLTIDGRSAPADVRMVGGVPYVRLSDVGKALGMTVSSKGGGRYALTRAGGANPIGGMAGKVGDTLFDGRWRFTVLGVTEPASYAMRTDSELYDEGETARMDRTTRVVTPGRNQRLVIVRVRVVNGTKSSQALWTAMVDKERVHTALADTDGGSHVPLTYDYPGAPVVTAAMLPGAAMTFGVVFALPTDTKPKDLIFTLRANEQGDRGHDVRVSLGGGR